MKRQCLEPSITKNRLSKNMIAILRSHMRVGMNCKWKPTIEWFFLNLNDIFELLNDSVVA